MTGPADRRSGLVDHRSGAPDSVAAGDTQGLTVELLGEVLDERRRQDATWGEQDHPSLHRSILGRNARDPEGMAAEYGIPTADRARHRCQLKARAGVVTWADILIEEVAEVVEAGVLHGEQALRGELVQVAAVAVAWIECIDRRHNAQATRHTPDSGLREKRS